MLRKLLFTLLFVLPIYMVACSNADEPLNFTPEQESDSESEPEPEPEPETYLDFDATYGACSGSTLVENLYAAIDAAAESGDVILMGSAEYDFERENVAITQSDVKISGKIMEQSADDLTTMGAMNIGTTFKNFKRFAVTADNFELRNVRVDSFEGNTVYSLILIKPEVTTDQFGVETVVKYYMGMKLYNVHLEGKLSTHVYVRSGAGGNYEHVTFIGFTGGGVAANRYTKEDSSPETHYKYCRFRGDQTAGYNCRGISHDAGNTEYPVIWSVGTYVDRCLFESTGVGFSRSRNAEITNCIFDNTAGEMDMIHMEEYTTDILIDGNTFIFNNSEGFTPRGFYLDRERQFAGDITITNNKFSGSCKWIVSAYSPQGLNFSNNDLTEVTLGVETYGAFDMTYLSDSHEATPESPLNIPAKNFTFRNNKGFSFPITLYAEQGDTSNNIDAAVQLNTTKSDFTHPFEAGDYYIYNYQTERYVCLDGSLIATTKDIYEAERWTITPYELQNYSIKSTTTGNYLESFLIYTLSDVNDADNDPSDNTIGAPDLFQTSNYAGKSRVPNYLLTAVNNGTAEKNLFLLTPGGNERKSWVVDLDGRVTLKAGRNKSKYYNYTDTGEKNGYALWKLVKTDTELPCAGGGGVLPAELF